MGGLARKATVINDSKADSIPMLILDSGDLFFAKNRLAKPNDDLESAKIRCEIIIDSYNAMGCDGFSPGSRDFALGMSYLGKLKEKSNFDYISCNIYNASSSELLFNEYEIKNINGARVALVGAASSFKKDSIFVKEPIEAIGNTLSKISGESDFTVLLFNGTDSDLDRLQASDLKIDLILRSKGSSKATEHGGREKIPLYSAGNKGKYLNKIKIKKTDFNQGLTDITLEKSNIKLSNKRINNKRKKTDPKGVPIEQLYKDNPKILEDIAKHREKIDNATNRIDNAINKLESEKIPLNSKVASYPNILKIVDEGMVNVPKGPPHHHHHHHNHKH